jgi:ribosomal protein S18 acetylase RimI-like enzyme
MQDFRRSHGATGVVALRKDNGTILGSAECSTLEFQGTRLGDTSDSLLYITSVSVAPTARKQGIASKMIRKIHDIAEARSTESIFLHVDTENETVIRLYEKFGYEIQDKLIHSEFTTSLNLHDDAIPGRKHYLMCKQLV